MFDSLPEPEGFGRTGGELSIDSAAIGCLVNLLVENPDRLAENLDRLLESPDHHRL